MRQCTALFTATMAGIILGLLSVPALSADPGDAGAIAHIDASGRAGYQTFSTEPLHRAFAIAPGGAWAWVSGEASVEAAQSEALAACRLNTQQPCHLYAVDDQVVFDETSWAASWDLHLNADQAKAATVGTGRASRFPDLALTAPDGNQVALSDFQGKPVFLHFWGSWCPPCQAEFADLQKLYDALADDDAVAFVLVQGRELIAKSRRWAAKRGFTMPLYDSGHNEMRAQPFHMVNGSQVSDRRLATVYPSTYVLDKRGLVVFHHAGPVMAWEQYETLLRHLVR